MAGLSRRTVAIGGGLMAYAALWQVWLRRAPALDFRPIAGLPGWHFAVAGALTGGTGAGLATLGLEPPPETSAAETLFDTLHFAQGTGQPVAVFSDFFCPFCRDFVPRLSAREEEDRLQVSWHELPLQGPASALVARAAVAADMQGGYPTFHAALRQTGFRPTSAAMADAAREAGLDAPRLVRDMDGPEVAARLGRSSRIAATLGIAGTPGVVFGRHVVLGAFDAPTFDALLKESV